MTKKNAISIRRCVAILFFFFAYPFCVGAQKLPAIDTLVSTLLEEDKFSGSVLLAKNGTVLYHRTAGYSNKVEGTALLPSNLFSIASTGKLFTAVIIERLIQNGKLQLNHTVSQYLPNLNIPHADKITIRQLLNHTAGVGNYMMHPSYAKMLDTISSSETLVKLISQTAVTNAVPSGQHVYSNSGYIILGKIIEAITKIPYEGALHSFVVKPAKMEDILFRPNFAKNNMLARGHVKNMDGKIWSLASSGSFPAADGGCYTTAMNLFLFDQAFYGNKLLSEKGRKEMQDNAIDADLPGLGKIRYGLGLMRFDYSNNTYAFGHNGGFPGYGCEYRHYFLPDGTEYTLIITSNFDRSIRPLLFKIESMIVAQKL